MKEICAKERFEDCWLERLKEQKINQFLLMFFDYKDKERLYDN